MTKTRIPIRPGDKVRLSAPVSVGRYRYDTVATVNIKGETVVELAPFPFTTAIAVDKLEDYGISYKITGYYRP